MRRSNDAKVLFKIHNIPPTTAASTLGELKRHKKEKLRVVATTSTEAVSQNKYFHTYIIIFLFLLSIDFNTIIIRPCTQPCSLLVIVVIVAVAVVLQLPLPSPLPLSFRQFVVVVVVVAVVITILFITLLFVKGEIVVLVVVNTLYLYTTIRDGRNSGGSSGINN